MRTKILILAFVILNSSLLILNCPCQWVQMSNGMGLGTYVYSLATSGNSPEESGQIIFTGTYDFGVYLSTNNGQNWIQKGLNNKTVLSLIISEIYIFAGTQSYGVLLSTNNGQDWIQTSINDKSVYSFAVSGDNIFSGTYLNGIWLSTNNGQNWTQKDLNDKTILSIAISENFIFAGTYIGGVYLSSNNGQNWIQTALHNKPVYSIAVSENNIFAGTDGSGVMRSTNNGQNWTQTAMTNLDVYSLAIYGNNIFAGTLDSGVWLSTNNGVSWIEKNQSFNPIPSVKALLIANDYIFAGTFGHSIWRRSLSEIIGIKNISTEIPSAFSLEQNYPNPFNSNTIIRFQIGMDSRFRGNDKVVLKVFDLLGKEVATLVNEYLQPGTYETTLDASTLTSGIYFYRLQTDKFTDTKKLILLK